MAGSDTALRYEYNSDRRPVRVNRDQTLSSGKARYRQSVFLDGAPAAYLVDDELYAVHTDHLGTPRLLTDNQGQTVLAGDLPPIRRGRDHPQHDRFPAPLAGPVR